MILADSSLFRREHFEAQKGVAPAHLCELVVYCLELVSQLAHTGLEFRFKGGNSQLVLLENPQRFSIDVDIVTTVTKEQLTAAVETIAAECEMFTRCEVRPHKTKPWLPMISFKLFFDSCYQAAEDAFVMLDAVLEEAPYAGVRKQVRCGELYQSSEQVELPAISGLIADKLLCIGPSTVGIPLGKNKEAQRLKHVFDVATLSRHDHDLEVVQSATLACLEQENRIQRASHGLAEVAADTVKFCSEPLAHTQPPDPNTLEPQTYLQEIAVGFAGFGSYLFRESYSWARFKEDCGQVISVMRAVSG